MTTPDPRAIADAVAARAGRPELVDLLAALPGSELRSLLLAVMAERAGSVRPVDPLNQHARDRFVRPSPIDLQALIDGERRMLAAVADRFEPVRLAPLVPFGVHHALGDVPQNNVVTTIRGTEVAADPTVGLALEVAVRRRRLLKSNPSSAELVELATTQRITRAQTFEGPRSFAHFSLLGLATGGRDTGNLAFEQAAMLTHATAAVEACHAAGCREVRLAVTDFSGEATVVVEALLESFAGEDGVTAEHDPDRTHAEGYYPSLCFKVHGVVDGARHEYGDGGLVPWSQALLGNRKERLMISGLSVDRLVMDHPD